MNPKPNQYNQLNFRGSMIVQMVTVLEGEGTEVNPYGEVRYIYDQNGEYLGIVTKDLFTHNYLQ